MSRKNYKRIKGGGHLGINSGSQFDDSGYRLGNKMLEAMTNPDLLSDEQSMYAERDFDAEAERREYLTHFRLALKSLTERQKQVVRSLKYSTQEDAAKFLGIARSTLSMHLQIIQRKITKAIGKSMAKGHEIGRENENAN